MSSKTGGQIELDVFTIINASPLKTAISGKIYKHGMRPINAKSEDAVVSFLTGLDDEIQTGIVNLNIYVSDIKQGASMVKNGERCRELEELTRGIIQGQTPQEYRFRLGAIIQTFAAEGTDQHFVSAKIKFQLATF